MSYFFIVILYFILLHFTNVNNMYERFINAFY